MSLRGVLRVVNTGCLCFSNRASGFLLLMLATTVLQLVAMFVLSLLMPNIDLSKTHPLPTHVLVTIIVLQGIQVALMFAGIASLVHKIWEARIAQAFAVYICCIVTFAGVYLICYEANHASFDFASSTKSRSVVRNVPQLWVTFVYLSVVTQTSTGFGDIAPVLTLPALVSVLQQFTGVVFNIFIVSQLLTYMRASRKKIRSQLSERRTACGRFLHQLSALGSLRSIRRFIRRFMLVVVIVVEAIVIMALYFSNDNIFQKKFQDIAFIEVAGSMQLLLVVATLSVSLRFARYAEEVTGWFLIQAYLSVILQFAGLYVTLFFANSSPRPMHYPKALAHDGHPSPWTFMLDMVYFSSTCMTSTGYGDIVPDVWYMRLVVCAQMLCATFVHTAVLGLGLDRLSSKRFQQMALREAVPAEEEPDAEGITVYVETKEDPAPLVSMPINYRPPAPPRQASLAGSLFGESPRLAARRMSLEPPPLLQ